ncbi:MAG: DUF4186 domain-containing protein [Alphaproteobacteria bacterium]|nr:DUF4186 domain-containing protein [Alphaproteobacteria bacterium]
MQKDIFDRLAKSKFRSRFKLTFKDKEYVRQKGMPEIRRYAEDFIARRLAPAFIENDGKQTPMRNHPVFIAQHATGCCCRQCLGKWHNIPSGVTLTAAQQKDIVDLIMAWIEKQMAEN